MLKNKLRCRLDVDERKKELVELGKKLFAKLHYEELSIADVAAKAGISKGLLYHYFKTKREFYIETIRAAADELVEKITSAPQGGEPLDRLRFGIRAYLEYVEEHSGAYQSLMSGGLGVDAEVFRIIEGVRSAVIADLFEGIGQKQKPTALQRLALYGWLGFVEAASLEWLKTRAPKLDEVQKLLERQLFHIVVDPNWKEL